MSDTRFPSRSGRLLLRAVGFGLWICVVLALGTLWFSGSATNSVSLETTAIAEDDTESADNPDAIIKLKPVDPNQRRTDQHRLPEPIPLPDFEFTERNGRKITKQDLLGKKWAACFVFSRCAGPCPQIMGQMRLLHEAVKKTDVLLVTITVDPENDTPEVLQKYAETFRADDDKWLFLTGERDDIYQFITMGFRLAAAVIDNEPIHTNRVALVNEKGEYVANYLFPKVSERIALRRALLGTSLRSSSQKRIDDNQTAPRAEREIPAWVEQLPFMNALLNSIATLLLIAGFVFIKQKNIAAHKASMLTCFAVSVAFLACYLLYHGQLTYYTGQGHKTFTGTGVIVPIYRTILVTHVILAAAVPFLAVMTIYRGLNNQVEKHRKIAKITFPIWVYVSVTGVIIYVLNYQWPGA